MQGILLHEFGHALGLDHDSSSESVMFRGYQWTYRYGPFEMDVDDLRGQYGIPSSDRFKIRRSADQGLSWTDQATNLTGLGVITTNDPAAVRHQRGTTLFYTDQNRHPAWIHGTTTGSSFDTRRWSVFGGERSAFGTTGHGYDNEMMMAWVDDTNDHRIRVVYSSDGGQRFSRWANPPVDARSDATPAIQKVGADPRALDPARHSHLLLERFLLGPMSSRNPPARRGRLGPPGRPRCS